jgi:peptidoglycan/xylan/chitin deacetylase (PgdA/CDA1 family)
VKRLVKRWLAALLCALGLHHVARWLHRRQLLILAYHGVSERPGLRSWWHLVPADQFTQQLRYLTRHYRLLSLDDALRELWSGELKQPTACLTFDDGYHNNCTVALPILRAFQAPATVYLATGMVGTNRRLWSVVLESAFVATSATSVTLEGTPTVVHLPADSDGRRTLAHAVIDQLKLLPPAARDPVLADLHAQLGDGRGGAASDDFAMMNWADARTMEATGLVSFGGHTMNHEIVSRLDEQELECEIDGCLSALRGNLTRVSPTFAFPNGRPEDFDERSIAVLRRAGAVAALSTIAGLNNRATNSFALRRISVGDGLTYNAFRLQTSGLVSALKSWLLGRRGPGASHGQGAMLAVKQLAIGLGIALVELLETI